MSVKGKSGIPQLIVVFLWLVVVENREGGGEDFIVLLNNH